jgi:endonuclease YncB( thermonuclease family)
MSILLATAAVVSAGHAFTCTPTRVWDGDGPVWCAEGPRIRLAGIATREIDGTCRPNQPCPTVSAGASRDALVHLLGLPIGRAGQGHVLVKGAAMRCVSSGGDGYGRTIAWCVSPKSGDLSCAMVQSGFALPWERYWGGKRCN